MTTRLTRIAATLVATLAAALVAAAPALATPPTATPKVEPGNWTTTTEITLTGLPVALPPSTLTVDHCVTAADVKKGLRQFAETTASLEGCVSRVTPRPGTATRWNWSLSCHTSALDEDGRGQITYQSPRHFTGTLAAVMALPGGLGQPVSIALGSARTGPCTP